MLALQLPPHRTVGLDRICYPGLSIAQACGPQLQKLADSRPIADWLPEAPGGGQISYLFAMRLTTV